MKNAFLLLILTGFMFSCSKDRVKPPVPVITGKITGTVIGKETCHNDVSADYWLIELEPTGESSIGEAVTFGGQSYTHLVKTRNIKDDAKVVGKKFSFEYSDYSDVKVETTGCQVDNPVTVAVPELMVSGYTGI